jgi:hypothetical protein
MSSTGWGDAGLYVNKRLRFFPKGKSMSCKHIMKPGRTYTVGVTRSLSGSIGLYLNGAQCFLGFSSTQRSYKLDQHNVDFFHDDGDENSAGYVQSIRMMSTAYTEEQMADDAKCAVPAAAKECPRQIYFRPQDTQMQFSSVYNDDKVGTGNARARINSPQAWVPKKSQAGEYMQIDTGEVQSIAGVVTQGRRDAAWWVTSLAVHISSDGEHWTPLQCGVEFPANENQNSKVRIMFRTPVSARFVRLLPDTWNGGIGMRASVIVCERKCEENKLDYDFDDSFLSTTKGPALDPQWGEGSFEGQNGYRFGDAQGLVVDQSQCLASAEEWTIFMNFRLDATGTRTALLRSDGWGDYGLYVDQRQVTILPRGAELTCDELLVSGKYYKVVISRSNDGTVSIYLNGYKCGSKVPPYVHNFLPSDTELTFLRSSEGEGSAGFIKRLTMWGKTLGDQEIADICECKIAGKGEKCDESLVLNSPYHRFKFSSTYGNSAVGTYLAMPRLASPYAWCAGTPDVGQWVQIDTGVVQTIVGVVMQGRRDAAQWVTSFKVMVSQDQVVWDDVQCGRVFNINPNDVNERVKTVFEEPLMARYVRIYPQTWFGFECMRAGVLLCQKPCKDNQLDYTFKNNFLVSFFCCVCRNMYVCVCIYIYSHTH